MTEFIDGFLEGLPEVDGFILKGKSPTSGLRGVKIYPKARDAGGISDLIEFHTLNKLMLKP